MSQGPTPASSSPATWLPRGILGLLGLHLSRGLLPIVPVEGDDLGVVNGLEAWARGSGDFADAGYIYAVQPGSYHVLAGLTRLSGLSPMLVFGICTLVSAAAFIALASFVLADSARLRPAWVAVALLLTQEITTAAYYANTSAMAGAWVMAGLLVTQRARRPAGLILAGLLIGFGGWLRMDSLLLSPLALLLRAQAVRPGPALRETAVIAAVSVLTLALGCATVGLGPTAISQQVAAREVVRDWHTLLVNGWLVLGPVATLASLLGLLWLGASGRWQPLGLVLVGVVPSLAFYGGNFTSPKYLYYAAAWMLLPVLCGLPRLWQAGRAGAWVAGAVLAAFAGESLLGVQSSSPEFRRFDPALPAVATGSLALAGKQLRTGLGEGEIIPTDDGPRLRGGQFWAPLFWRREKAAMRQELATFAEVMTSRPPALVITSTYLSFRVADGWLRQHGYRIGPPRHFPGNPSSYTREGQSPDRTVILAQINQTPADAAEFGSLLQPAVRTLFVNDRGEIGFRRLAGPTAGWRALSSSGNRLITLHEYPSR
jgi:hypothetical protein